MVNLTEDQVDDLGPAEPTTHTNGKQAQTKDSLRVSNYQEEDQPEKFGWLKVLHQWIRFVLARIALGLSTVGQIMLFALQCVIIGWGKATKDIRQTSVPMFMLVFGIGVLVSGFVDVLASVQPRSAGILISLGIGMCAMCSAILLMGVAGFPVVKAWKQSMKASEERDITRGAE